MTTATAPRISREVLEARWDAAVLAPKHFEERDGSRSIGLDNCEDFYEWEEAVAEIATRLRGDGLNGAELEQVEEIAASIWGGELKDRLMTWAEEHAR